MRIMIILVFAMITTISVAQAGALANSDFDPCSFEDAETGLYWLDPMVFCNVPRAQVDEFIARSAVWQWATGAQISGLLNSYTANGSDLDAVLGPWSSSIYGGDPEWWGLHAEASPPAWKVACYEMTREVIDHTSAVDDLGDNVHGAWLVSTQDPGAQPRLDHLGSDEVPYFHDQATGYYWCDPAQFVGLDHDAIEAWLVANPDWRWAVSDEVSALVGKLCLDHVLAPGVPQVEGNYHFQYVGYCGDLATNQAFILQYGLVNFYHTPSFPLFTSVLDDPPAASTGAWIVSTVNPTPTEARSLSEVKQLFD